MSTSMMLRGSSTSSRCYATRSPAPQILMIFTTFWSPIRNWIQVIPSSLHNRLLLAACPDGEILTAAPTQLGVGTTVHSREILLYQGRAPSKHAHSFT